ncbi:hypothetical protein ASE04_03180 [Rhizobium sp. Root708]|uniref:hypothetical protein n=1 Tax=Rhizobium sp. Root708 TaxID=1736592 RepID=UPI0006F66EF1|nr:hypothetical protein [Rhizobium sp. Root708]KRB58715.1 hypothetical protein ASE04_03180 [Rhizobium sp. Root708]
MLKRDDDCRIRWLIRTKQIRGLQAEDDEIRTIDVIKSRDATSSFVNSAFPWVPISQDEPKPL